MSLFPRSALGLLLLLPALAASPAGAQAPCGGPASATRLYVNVQGLRSASGLVAVTVYGDNAKKFLATRGALYVVRVPAKAGTTRVCVHLPATGVYGLAVYHDVDADRSFDKNSLGLPAEAFGFSNNPKLLFGLPAFSSVRLRVPRNNMWTNVRLKYP